MNKFRSGRKWLKGKLRGRLQKAPEERKLIITLTGTSIRDGPFPTQHLLMYVPLRNAILVEKAREDAQAMHIASKTQPLENTAG
ncbi:uncharacterized protein Z520_01870 [Fonsecaea multimorphosa CBS 102226]|uniref:Uncharacterized protein n=1 Tax=Fonsecaea multimorphosa CBS 102226 TaxID=1442371 RepID=A0A0D2IXF9_9EURO|nr:uncharacterized protein Z520_01870 [Fonsecaea multimorphosa CBS 102226]KIY01732.1 hypothetical protein Z520_01870 [Fonsecaea multimorphosa CBS 102226]